MAISFRGWLARGRKIITEAGASKLALGALILAASTAILLFLLLFKSSDSYAPLYARLSPEDAGAISAELKAQKIPFKLSGGGTVIEVPAARLALTRLELAVKGLPGTAGQAYELFGEQKPGAAGQAQKSGLGRSVAAELERTLSSLAEVESAGVLLHLPEGMLFVEDQPTASVVIKRQPGAELSQGQVMSIVDLLRASVPGLTSDNISLLDYKGGLIWSNELNKISPLNYAQFRQKALYEDGLRLRLQAMMEKVLGPGRVVTSVNADLDFKEVISNEDIYDPDRSAVRRQQKVVDRSGGQGSNFSGEMNAARRQNSGAGDSLDINSRTEEINSYEVSNIKRQTVSRAGELKRISVAVVLDGIYTENQAGERLFSPLPDALLEQLEDAVKALIGFDEKRGDIVSLSSVQFPQGEQIPARAPFMVELAQELGRPLLNTGLIILFFFLVVRPLINWLKKESAPPALEGGKGGLPGLNDDEKESSRALDEKQADGIIEQPNAPLLFSGIKNIDSEALGDFIRNEHPQTIALVLAHIDSGQSARIISGLPPKLQQEVILRIADYKNVPVGILDDLEAALLEEIKGQAPLEGQAAGGPKAVAKILNEVDHKTENTILSRLEADRPELSKEVRKLMFAFEELLEVDDRSIRIILREVNRNELALALKAATMGLRGKIFANLSEQAAALLKEYIEAMGPARLSDAKKAQQSILRIAKKLEAEGRINIGRGDEGDRFV